MKARVSSEEEVRNDLYGCSRERRRQPWWPFLLKSGVAHIRRYRLPLFGRLGNGISLAPGNAASYAALLIVTSRINQNIRREILDWI